MEEMAEYIFFNSESKIYKSNKVLGPATSNENTALLKTEKSEQAFDLVFNCSGLFSDITYTSLTSKKSPIKIVPFRGEHMHIADEHKHLVNHLIYPTPDPKYPCLDIHFTKMIIGGREVGHRIHK